MRNFLYDMAAVAAILSFALTFYGPQHPATAPTPYSTPALLYASR